jgi:hypothetical protein
VLRVFEETAPLLTIKSHNIDLSKLVDELKNKGGDTMSDMPLERPTSEDQRKIHAEVNQLLNMVWLTNIAAIALTGTILAAVIGKSLSSHLTASQLATTSVAHVGHGQLENFTYITAASILLLFILLAVVVIGNESLKTIRFLTSYLVYTRVSPWEAHFIAACNKDRTSAFLYSRTRARLFIALGTIVFLMPSYYAQTLNPSVLIEVSLWSVLAGSFFFYLLALAKIKPNIENEHGVALGKWSSVFGEHKFNWESEREPQGEAQKSTS